MSLFFLKGVIMSINVIVCGAAGRMGKVLVSLVQEHQDTRLVGAIEAAGHWAIGKDAGEVAGVGPIGVKVTSGYDTIATQTRSLSILPCRRLHSCTSRRLWKKEQLL